MLVPVAIPPHPLSAAAAQAARAMPTHLAASPLLFRRSVFIAGLLKVSAVQLPDGSALLRRFYCGRVPSVFVAVPVTIGVTTGAAPPMILVTLLLPLFASHTEPELSITRPVGVEIEPPW